MKTEFKKLLLFGVLISFSTSVYVSFINTFMKQGFGTDHFVQHWLALIPKTYALVLPFVLITGPLVRKLVDKIVGTDKTNNSDSSTESTPWINRNARAKDNAGVIIFPPLLFLIAIAVGLFIRYESALHYLPASLKILGWIPIAAGIVVLGMAVNIFNKNNTTINPAGTSTTIVSKGIYRFTRNPMYISFALIYAGIMLVNQAGIGLMLLIPILIIVQEGIIKREELYLSKKFGTTYDSYRKQVNRWI